MSRNQQTLPRILVLALAGVASVAVAQSNAKPASDVAAVDGGLGPCSLELTINTADGKPVYAATVKVHIPYGFGGFHKLDLEAGTNAEGKVKFSGLPSRLRRPPLEFDATKDDLEGTITYDPATECRTKHPLVIEKPKVDSK